MKCALMKARSYRGLLMIRQRQLKQLGYHFTQQQIRWADCFARIRRLNLEMECLYVKNTDVGLGVFENTQARIAPYEMRQSCVKFVAY